MGRLTLIPPNLRLFRPNLSCPLSQFRHRSKIKVGIQMPKQGTRNANERSIFLLALPNHLNRHFVDHDFVVASFDEATGAVFELLAGLDEEVVARGDLDGDAVTSVAGPDVEARVAGAAVDGQEVKVGVKAGEDGVLVAVFSEV